MSETLETYKKTIIENYPTLRDNFAGSALTGLLANPNSSGSSHELLAQTAFEIADQMLKERSE